MDPRPKTLTAIPFLIVFSIVLLSVSPPTFAQEEALDLMWSAGPMNARLGSQAAVAVPEGYVFLDATDAQELIEYLGNPVSGNELGLIASAAEDENWFLMFEFSDIGYVPDDEKADLDPEQILKNIRKGNDQANQYRREHGVPPLEILGWEVAPQYNDTTHLLEWCLRAQSEDHVVLNHNTRLLGRRGVMSATLIVDPEEYATVLPVSADLLERFAFNQGSRYAEYIKGDRVAEIGLTALVAGGAGALAYKVGFFKKFAKLIFMAVAAIVAAVGRFFRKLTGHGEADSSSPTA